MYKMKFKTETTAIQFYMSRDKTWRKRDRVIASLKYGKRTNQRNPADIFHHLPNT
jgi:hypothetical protein